MLKVFTLITVIFLLGFTSQPSKPNKAPGDFSFIGGDGSTTTGLPPSSFQNVNEYEEYFYCPVYGPFSVGDPDFTATFDYKLKITNQTIIERVRVLNSMSEPVYAASQPSRGYFNNALMTVSFTIPIHDYLTNNGITIMFEILNSHTRNIIKEYHASIYPLSYPTNLTAQYLRNNVYTTNNVAFYGDGVEMRGVNETFDFRNIDDYFDVDYYYRMNLSSLIFTYESAFELTYSGVSLRFKDDHHLFPYMTHDNNDNIVLPISLVRSGKYVTLKFKNKFYVNKRTLQTSDTYRDGFALSSDFYLPVNGKRFFNDQVLYLDFYLIGKCGLSSSFPITYLVDKSLASVCHDGLHCISGGSR